MSDEDTNYHLRGNREISHRPTIHSNTTEQLEEDVDGYWQSYAGGIKTNYRFNEKQLFIADCKI